MDQGGNPFGTPVAAVSAETTAAGFVFIAGHQSKATIVRFPGGAANGDYLVTLSEAIDDPHMTMLPRIHSDIPLVESCSGATVAPINDPTIQKRLIIRATTGGFTATDPIDFTIEFRRTLASF